MAYLKAQSGRFVPNTDMTPLQIYIGFRTSPVGALSVNSSLFMSASFVGGLLYTSYQIGHAVGTWAYGQMLPAIPDRLDNLGANVAMVVDWFQSVFSSPPPMDPNGSLMNHIDNIQVGNFQQSVAPSFELSPAESTLMQMGGDYGITQPWADVAPAPPPPGGGGCGGGVEAGGCPVLH